MKILVVGSTTGSLQAFSRACYLIGQAIGLAKYDVVLGSNRISTADHHVMMGLRSIAGTHRVTIVRPIDDIKFLPPDQVQSTAPDVEATAPEQTEIQRGNLDITYHPVRGPWGVGRITQLLQCDGVIAIGGKKGTREVIEAAPELRRPIVAIPSFGGVASEVWSELLHDYRRSGITANDYLSLGQPWQDDHAKLAVGLISRLVRKNPYSDKALFHLSWLFVAIVTLFVLWAAAFAYPCNDVFGVNCSNNRVSIFILFWISAFLGTSLRAAKRLLEDSSLQPSAATLLIEGSVGLAVSFGLSLLYMAGLFLASDDANIFPLLAEGSGDAKFRRTAVLMSLISFAGAFLLEPSLAKLDEKLRERVLNEK